jgi:predicted RNA binding protein YcfA (HicA-like mRNA interferase family)
MTGRTVRKILKDLGCEELRWVGSHLNVRCGACQTSVPIHGGEDIGYGLLKSVEKDLAPCLGKRWLGI